MSILFTICMAILWERLNLDWKAYIPAIVVVFTLLDMFIIVSMIK